MNLQEFREKFPQYNDMEDRDLAEGLYKKYYSDMPKEKFYAHIGVELNPASGSVFSRIADRVSSAVQPIWEAPMLGQKDIQELPIDPVSKGLLQSGAAFLDAGGRVMQTIARGAGAVSGQVAEELGETPTMARRLERDVGGLVEMGEIVLGARAPTLAPRVRAPRQQTEAPEAAVVPEDPTAPKQNDLKQSFGAEKVENYESGELRQMGAESPLNTRTDLMEDGSPSLPLQRRVANAAKEILQAGDVPVSPSGDQLRLYEQVSSLLRTGRIEVDELDDILAKNGITRDDFSKSAGLQYSNAGRTLQILSDLSKSLKEIDAKTTGQIVDDRNIFRRINDIRRGLMVSQIKTAARNATTAVANIGVQTVNRAIEYGIRRAAQGRFGIDQVGEEVPMQTPMDAFGLLVQTARPRESRKILKEALKYDAAKYDQLMRAYSADVTLNGGKSIFRPVEKVVHALNVFNRAQDQIFRSIAFSDSIIRQMKTRGVDARQLLRENKMDQIPSEVLDKATEDALEFTFSGQPKSKLGQGIVNTFDNPALSVLVPFPRFLVASTRYTVEHSPLGLGLELAKGTAGKSDVTKIAKGITGTGLFLGAYTLANSEFGGDKWYRYKIGGKDIDLRAYYPFAAAAWVGDTVKRLENGTLYNLNFKDLAEGLIGVQFRGGTGNYLIDGFVDVMQGDGTAQEKGLKAAGRLAGEYIASFGVPLQQFRDAYSLYDPDSKIVFEVNKNPLTDPIVSRLPGGGTAADLQPAISPFRQGPIERQNPITSQLTGVTISQPMTAIQAELSRLDLPQSTYIPRYRNEELRRFTAQEAAKILDTPQTERMLSNFIGKFPNNPKGNALARLVQKEIGAAIKAEIKKRVEIARPDLIALEKVAGQKQELQRIAPEELGRLREQIKNLAPQ